MHRLFRQAITSIIAAATLLVSGCGGKTSLSQDEIVASAFDDLRVQVARVIDDDGREATALALVDRLERDYEALSDSVVARRTRVRALSADYDATREALVALTDQLETAMREARNTVATTHRELIAATTAEEWASIAKADTKTMKAAITALQSI